MEKNENSIKEMENLKMRDIIFIVESAIHSNDGYKTRIEMELGILEKIYNCYILVPCGRNEEPPEFIHKVNVLKFHSYSKEVPFIFNFKKLKNALREFLNNHPKAIVIGEAHTSAIMICEFVKKKNSKFVFDCHGTTPDEVYLCHHNVIGLIYALWIKYKERHVLMKSDLIITVSKQQYKYWGINKRYVLLPMLPTEIFFDKTNYRNKKRRELNIPDDKLVYLYSGQDQAWQNVDKTLEIYKKTAESDNTKLLIYTHDVKKITNKIKKHGVKDYIVCSVQYNEMPQYLDVADFGYCIRDGSIVNRVASPTKVLEYLSRNVKPILSETVGDFSEELEKLNLACIVKDLTVENNEKKFLGYEGLNYVKDYREMCIEKYLKEIKQL